MWANDINPAKNERAGRVNCGECARAVQDTWSGDPTSAAKMAPGLRGEPVSRMNDWSGGTPQPATMNQVSERLQELGPGSSAIVRSNWSEGGAHYFNGVNDNGVIKAVDGQSGKVETWPPSTGGLRFDETQMAQSYAIYFNANGEVI
jgi:hypothetical protein